ncbi:MAG: hypothetical protein P3W89_005580 [Aquificaceae bacterium]|nr:hypothetical protein [Aquificaceae bacterium]
MRRVFLLLITLLSFYSLSTAKEVPFTQEDRDKLRNIEIKVERLEVKVEEGQKALQAQTDGLQKQIDGLQRQVDGLQKQIDELRSDFRTYMSIVIGSIIALVGFIIWDRRTAISPVVKKTKELEDRGDKIEKVLKDLAKEDPKIAEALKRAGLL